MGDRRSGIAEYSITHFHSAFTIPSVFFKKNHCQLTFPKLIIVSGVSDNRSRYLEWHKQRHHNENRAESSNRGTKKGTRYAARFNNPTNNVARLSRTSAMPKMWLLRQRGRHLLRLLRNPTKTHLRFLRNTGGAGHGLLLHALRNTTGRGGKNCKRTER